MVYFDCVLNGESLPNRYSALSLAHVCACVTGLQHSELYRFGRFALNGTEPFRSRANSLPGANRPIGPWPIRSLELSLPGTFAPWLFRSLAFSLPGQFAPGPFVPRPFRSGERKFYGTYVPRNFRSLNVSIYFRCLTLAFTLITQHY